MRPVNRWATAQVLVQRGGRFSLNASAPSRASADWRTGTLISRCRSNSSSRRPVPALGEDALGRGHRQRTVAGDGLRQLDRGRQGGARGHHPVHQARPLGLRGRHEVAGEGPLRRQVVGDPRRDSRSSPPPAATRPRLTSGRPNRASSAATIRSHASTISNPPAIAVPSTAAIDRLGGRPLDDPGEAAAPDRAALAGQERLEVHARAERAARAGEHARGERRVPFQLSIAWEIAHAVSVSIALRTSGRFSVRTRTPPRRSVSSFPPVIEASSAERRRAGWSRR